MRVVEFDARSAAAITIHKVLTERRSLTDVLNRPGFTVAANQRALWRELSAGSLRWYWPLAAVANKLLSHPMKQRDHDVWCLLLIGLYQINWLNIHHHTAVNETVNACERLGSAQGKKWARGLINALLRQAIRRQRDLFEFTDDPQAQHAHPQWMIDLLRRDWPNDWTQIIAAGNQRPGMSVRVNVRRQDRDTYLQRLSDSGINAKRCTISEQGLHIVPPVAGRELPGFDDGDVSIQDHGAQLVARLVNPKPGERILDACAAPGGKACHLLESEPEITLTLIDVSATRLERAENELTRLGLAADIKCADILEDNWDDNPRGGERYDCILIDAPCSGSGVISRHPDIKHLRLDTDIVQNNALQQRLLDSLWPKLTPTGRLVYVTCSVFQQENADVINAFCRRHPEAILPEMDAIHAYTNSAPGGVGRQRLPVAGEGDGFYFAVLTRQSPYQ